MVVKFQVPLDSGRLTAPLKSTDPFPLSSSGSLSAQGHSRFYLTPFPQPHPPSPPPHLLVYFREHEGRLSTFLSKALIWLQHRHSNLCRMRGQVAYSDALQVELDVSVQTRNSGTCRAGQSPWQGSPLSIYMLKAVSATGTLRKNKGLPG